MIKLICKQCGAEWYTANTLPNQKCNDCKGELEDAESNDSKDVE